MLLFSNPKNHAYKKYYISQKANSMNFMKLNHLTEILVTTKFDKDFYYCLFIK